MMRAALLLITIAASVPAAACTTFCVRGPDGLVFGRNYDYFIGEAMVLTNAPRRGEGLDCWSGSRPGGPRGTAASRSTSSARDNPMGGVNERGLVVELMELPESRYPDPDSRPALGSLEWVQYLLDNFGTVEEAIAGAKRVRIGTRMGIHYLLADRGGDVAAIEFLGGRMVDAPRRQPAGDRVLANSPYDDSLAHAARIPSASPSCRAAPLGSLERFARAARAVARCTARPPPARVDKQLRDPRPVAQKGHTQWQIVYDLSRSTIHYRTTANRERRTLAVSGLRLRMPLRAADARHRYRPRRRDRRPAALRPEANERQMLHAFGSVPHFGMTPAQVRAEAAQIESTRRCVAAG